MNLRYCRTGIGVVGRRFSATLALAAALGFVASGSARAQALLDEVGLIANPAVGANPVPDAQTFTISEAGSYTVTLTDLQSPQALGSLQLAVASSSATLVQMSAAGTTASQMLTLQPGTYTEQVLAVAATGSLGGSFSVTVTAADGSAVPVTPVGGSTSASTFVGAVAPPAGTVSGQSVLETPFTVTDAGSYQLTLTDLAFPVALEASSFDVAVWNDAAPGTLLVRQVDVGAGSFNLGTLPAGSYELLVVAQAASPGLQGLYSLSILGGSSGTSSALAMTVPVGALPAASPVTIPASEGLSLTLRDLASPAALASLQTILVQGGTVLQGSAGAGSYTIASAAAGTAELYVAAQPNSAAGEGAYTAVVSGGGQTLLDIAEPVTDASHDGYAFSTTLSAAGSYQIALDDLQLPAPLGSLSALVEQAGTLLADASLAAGGSAALSPEPQPGRINVVAFAEPPSIGGLFGLQLAATPSGTVAYQTVQGVGAAYHTQTITLSSSGIYEMQLTDLEFPAKFAELDAIVTSGEQMVGQIDGTGEVSWTATPGTYQLNLLAQTGTLQGGSAADYGLYGVHIASMSPAPPTPSSSSSGSGGSGSLSGGTLAVLAATLLRTLRRRRSRPSAG